MLVNIYRLCSLLKCTCSLLLVGSLSISGLAQSEEKKLNSSESLAATNSTGYLNHPEFLKFLDEVTKTDGHSKEKLLALFASAERKDSILEAIAKPAEKTFTWARYRKIFITEDRINKGIEFYKQYKSDLQRAEKVYGVPASIIVAIIGVETRYGHHRGNYRVLDALATLGFDYPPRAKFFRGQLQQFLLLEKEAGINLTEAMGSYAGAMGFPQFIPSSYRHYAVDFDADQKIDLLNNPVDAIGSVANYFKEHRWQTGKPVASPARYLKTPNKKNTLDSMLNQDLKPKYTVADFTAQGLVPDFELGNTLSATGLKLEGENGIEYWIGLHNFYVITRYNHSHLYALAVHQLSTALAEKL